MPGVKVLSSVSESIENVLKREEIFAAFSLRHSGMRYGVPTQIFGISENFFETLHQDLLHPTEWGKMSGLTAFVPEGLRGHLFHDASDELMLCVNEAFGASEDLCDIRFPIRIGAIFKKIPGFP